MSTFNYIFNSDIIYEIINYLDLSSILILSNKVNLVLKSRI